MGCAYVLNLYLLRTSNLRSESQLLCLIASSRCCCCCWGCWQLLLLRLVVVVVAASRHRRCSQQKEDMDHDTTVCCCCYCNSLFDCCLKSSLLCCVVMLRLFIVFLVSAPSDDLNDPRKRSADATTQRPNNSRGLTRQRLASMKRALELPKKTSDCCGLTFKKIKINS
jgi:hypothetical protein